MKLTKEIIITIMNQIDDIIVSVFDKKGNYTLFNHAHKNTMQELWGMEVEQGMCLFDVIGSDQDRHKAQRGFNRALLGDVVDITEEFGDSAHHRKHYKIRWEPVYDNQEIIGVLCVATNITKIVENQQELTGATNIFDTFFNHTSDGLFYAEYKQPIDWDHATNKKELLQQMLEEGFVVQVNQAMLDQLNAKKEQLVGQSLKTILDYPFPNVERDFHKILDKKKVTLVTYERTFDGLEVCIEGNYVSLVNENNHVVGLFGARRDITDRINAELALQQSHQLMKYIIENDRSAVAVHDKDLNYIYVSQKYLDDYRVKDRNIIGKHHYEVFPDLPQKWRDVHQRVLKGEILKSDKDLFIRSDGTRDWTRWECRPWYNEDQSIGGIVIYTEVINEQLRIENVLRENEQRLQAVFNQASVGICYGPPSNEFKEVNQKFVEIIGYTASELRNLSLSDITHPDDLDNNHEIKEQLLRKEIEEITLESRFIKKDQSVIVANVTLSLIHADNYSLPHVMMIVEDVTERKQIEKEMRYLNYHDQLTGLYNRRFYEEELRRLDTKRNYPISLVIADANGLKLINDAFGHQQGDNMLIKIAEVFKQECRHDEVIARIGGDELVILLPKTTKDEAQIIVDRINLRLEEHKINNAPISISTGIATKTSDNQKIMDVFKQAEEIMYHKKLEHRSETMTNTIRVILDALFKKNEYEMEHAHQVSEMCGRMGSLLNLEKNEISKLKMAGMMHDIGKINIPNQVLNKVSELNHHDWGEIKRHSEIGYRILNAVSEFAEVSEYVLAHHERWDGSGYPKGLKGSDIPLQARVIAIVDAFDTMTRDKPYRKAKPHEYALNELKKQSGKQFDPDLIELFIANKIYENNQAT